MEISALEFKDLTSEILNLCGIQLTEDKRYLVLQRLEPLTERLGLASFADLVSHIRGNHNKTVREEVIAAITTTESFFFRDNHPFDWFSQMLMPELVKRIQQRRTLGGNQVRIWCAASSTGQEPLSLSILIKEYLEAHPTAGISTADFNLVATDINLQVLEQAKKGEYSEWEMHRGLSDALRNRYFQQIGPYTYKADPKLVAMVDYKHLNLTQSFTHLGQFDVIFCRNVLIYFNEATKRGIIQQFSRMLPQEGYLVLGASENMLGFTEFTRDIHQPTLVYRPIHH